MANSPGQAGCALQLVRLNMEERKVEVNEESLAKLEKRLKELRSHKVAVISVMGAFRTGKSFLLDLFLRFLRYEQKAGIEEWPENNAPERGGNAEFPVPDWLTAAGECIEGAAEGSTDGFRFRGGMDHCTEGIWIWSEPFLRKVKGQTVALLLMDTQGAWDSNMTKEQSATVFGLTALISSKQIYNINMQIQEDKVENLAYFMRFAQAALRKAASDMGGQHQAEIERPFQALDFLVRDWANFEDEWTYAQCQDQMKQHLDRHVNPTTVVEDSTAQALQSMFHRITCFCLPHPGKKIQKAAWTGAVADIDRDFLRFMDQYVREVFTRDVEVKRILGSDLSSDTFPLLLRTFVKAFQDAAPAAMSFTQAMTSATVLLAKEQALKSYTKRMSEFIEKNPRGVEEKSFAELHRTLSSQVEAEYEGVTILGPDSTRLDTWSSIQESLGDLYKQYVKENRRRLEEALVAFANIALAALSLFLLDRLSDFACDWWSQTCRDVSKLMFTAYLGMFGYIGYHVYALFKDRGYLQTATASGELWKEMMRLIGIYGEIVGNMRWGDLVVMGQKAVESVMSAANGAANGGASSETKETKKSK